MAPAATDSNSTVLRRRYFDAATTMLSQHGRYATLVQVNNISIHTLATSEVFCMDQRLSEDPDLLERAIAAHLGHMGIRLEEAASMQTWAAHYRAGRDHARRRYPSHTVTPSSTVTEPTPLLPTPLLVSSTNNLVASTSGATTTIPGSAIHPLPATPTPVVPSHGAAFTTLVPVASELPAPHIPVAPSPGTTTVGTTTTGASLLPSDNTMDVDDSPVSGSN